MRFLLSSALLVPILLAGCGQPRPATSPPRTDPVAFGRYLVDHLYDCGSCHTPKLPGGGLDASRYLAGRECLFDVDPAPGRGCIHSRNLTHDATGLANVVDDRAVKEMFLDGRRPDGKVLHRAMPSWQFHNMPAEHADAIVAYLRTVPGVEHRVPANEPPFDQPPALPTPPIPMAIVPPPGPGATERGRVLAAAACLGCHTAPTPGSTPGEMPVDLGRLFAGGRPFRRPAPDLPAVVYSQNLTAHATGIGGWSVDDVVRVLKLGRDRHGKGVCAPMPAGPTGAFGGLSDADARDIASYLLGLPGIDNALPNPCAVDPARPTRLSQTGLDAPGVLAFTPRHELWSDGAEKRRWIRLPPGAAIDTSDMDHWRFPVGTRVWKEFRVDGRPVETRLIERTGKGPGDFWMGAFVWDEALGDAVYRPDGEENAGGTAHDVPAAGTCLSCHGGEPGRILGFSALQLAPATLRALADEGRLSRPPAPDALLGPDGPPEVRAALGYLHANCGHCHGETGLAYRDVDLVLRLKTGEHAAAETGVYRSTVGAAMQRGSLMRVAPGRPDESGILARLRSGERSARMPPIATERIDRRGEELLARWIAGLATTP